MKADQSNCRILYVSTFKCFGTSSYQAKNYGMPVSQKTIQILIATKGYLGIPGPPLIPNTRDISCENRFAGLRMPRSKIKSVWWKVQNDNFLQRKYRLILFSHRRCCSWRPLQQKRRFCSRISINMYCSILNFIIAFPLPNFLAIYP